MAGASPLPSLVSDSAAPAPDAQLSPCCLESGAPGLTFALRLVSLVCVAREARRGANCVLQLRAHPLFLLSIFINFLTY